MHSLHNIIIICINNTAVINNNYEILFFSSKFPWVHARISSRLMNNFGTSPHNFGSSAV